MRTLVAIVAVVLALPVAAQQEIFDPISRTTPLVTLPLRTSGNIPACSSDAYDPTAPIDVRIRQGCVMECGVGIYDGTDEWQCRKADGTQVPVQNAASCGVTTDTSIIRADGTQGKGLAAVSDSCAPYILNADVPAGALDVTRDFGVVIHHNGAISVNGVYLSMGRYNADGIYNQSSGCYFSGGVGVNQIIGLGHITYGGSSVQYCGRNGNNIEVFANGTFSSAALSITPSASSRNLYFGRYETTGFATDRPCYYARFYNRSLPTAELDRLNEILAGSIDATIVRATTGFSVIGDKVLSFGNNAAAVTTTGIYVGRSVTNEWVNSLDASAWTVVGTPTITTDTDAGPLSVYAGGNEADTITDDDAASKECVYVQIGTTTGDYTVSAYLAAGTITDYTLSVVTDGTGSVDCTGTDLTSTFSRKTCSATVGGTPTYVRGQLCVGDTAADTGSIKVSGAQGEAAAQAGKPCPAGASAATCAVDQITVPKEQLPTGQFEICLDYTPDNDAPSATETLVSSYTSGNGIKLFRSSTNDVTLESWQGGASSSCSLAAGSMTTPWQGGVTKRICAIWGPTQNAVYEHGGAAKRCASTRTVTSHGMDLHIGTDAGNALPANGSIKSVVIRRAP